VTCHNSAASAFSLFSWLLILVLHDINLCGGLLPVVPACSSPCPSPHLLPVQHSCLNSGLSLLLAASLALSICMRSAHKPTSIRQHISSLLPPHAELHPTSRPAHTINIILLRPVDCSFAPSLLTLFFSSCPLHPRYHSPFFLSFPLARITFTLVRPCLLSLALLGKTQPNRLCAFTYPAGPISNTLINPLSSTARNNKQPGWKALHTQLSSLSLSLSLSLSGYPPSQRTQFFALAIVPTTLQDVLAGSRSSFVFLTLVRPLPTLTPSHLPLRLHPRLRNTSPPTSIKANSNSGSIRSSTWDPAHLICQSSLGFTPTFILI